MIYALVKGFHILMVIAWMAGLLYQPRLLVYHSRATVGSEMDLTFRLMEEKLEKIIMTPAMIGALIFGLWLIKILGPQILIQPWMIAKLAGILFLIVWHHYLMLSRRRFARGLRPGSERFWRMVNELPFLAAIVIVLSVTTKWGV